MNLYTVTIEFDDRRRAVEQVECYNETEALHKVLREAQVLETYTKRFIEETIEHFLRITHVAMNYKGIWLWHHTNFDNDEMKLIYGGIIIQTDKRGAVRLDSDLDTLR